MHPPRTAGCKRFSGPQTVAAVAAVRITRRVDRAPSPPLSACRPARTFLLLTVTSHQACRATRLVTTVEEVALHPNP